VALGLAGISREEVSRGDTVVEANAAWEATTAFDVMLTLLPDAPRVLIPRSRVRLHIGTSEIIARVFPRPSRIDPGASGLARLALESPGVARGGDAFVIRGFSPVITIGGGRVIDPLPPRKKATWPAGLGAASIEARLDALIDRRPHGVSTRQLPVLLGMSSDTVQRTLAQSHRHVEADGHWVSRTIFDGLMRTAVETVGEFHRGRPGDPGIPLAELRQGLRTTPWLVAAVVNRLEVDGKLIFQDGFARRPDFHPRISGGNDLVNRVVAQIRTAGLNPPSTAELGQSMGAGDVTAALRQAARDGLVEPVERDRYYAREALEKFMAALVELGQGGLITPSQIRERLGISRKFLIPLLEWGDLKGLTVRVEEGRRLRNGAQLPWRAPVP
jgi:selenocysteine-specific elongation factor